MGNWKGTLEIQISMTPCVFYPNIGILREKLMMFDILHSFRDFICL